MITLTYTIGMIPGGLATPDLVSLVPGATKYDVHIWVASDTTQLDLVHEVVTATSYTIPSAVLTTGVRYGWTVFASNNIGWGDSMTAPNQCIRQRFGSAINRKPQVVL